MVPQFGQVHPVPSGRAWNLDPHVRHVTNRQLAAQEEHV